MSKSQEDQLNDHVSRNECSFSPLSLKGSIYSPLKDLLTDF